MTRESLLGVSEPQGATGVVFISGFIFTNDASRRLQRSGGGVAGLEERAGAGAGAGATLNPKP